MIADSVAAESSAYTQGSTVSDLKEFYRLQRQVEEKTQQARDARQAATITKLELGRLEKRWKMCLGVTLWLVLVYAWGVVTGEIRDMGYLWAWAIPVPFGFMPIKDFISKHGFYIVFTAFLLAILFAFVLMFCLFAAIPYAVSLRKKIAKLRKKAASFNEVVTNIEREVEAISNLI